jgi:hypothetical protein
MDPVVHFSRTYAEARDKFTAAATARAFQSEAHVLPEYRGASNETLATDVATLKPTPSEAVLMLTSGTHGIEGYCGSGIQVALMQDDDFLSAARQARVDVLFVHAVNPHGFSHGRRVNEDNVDINRNFCDFSRPLPVNAGYSNIHAMLVPSTWPPPWSNEAKMAISIVTLGKRRFQAAVTGGQYAVPDGLFYGGVRPTWSNRTLRAIVATHCATRKRIGWIDLHTGLGPRGRGEKIFLGRNEAADFARAREWWGEEVTSMFDGSSSSALVTGLICNVVYDECDGAEYTGITLEYGTVPVRRALHALRGDHWLANHPEAPRAQHAAIRQEMRDAFYIDAADWKQAVYAQARAAALRALAKLSASA